MKYFCPVCKKKHDITEMAVDVFVLFREKLRSNVAQLTENDTVQEELPIYEAFRKAEYAADNRSRFTETVFQLHGKLNGFLSRNPDTGARFRVSTDKIASKIKGSATTITVRYNMKLRNLLEVFRTDSALTDVDRELLNRYQSIVPPELLDMSILTELITLHYTRISFDGKEELLFQKVTDSNGGHFEQGGRLLGFMRLCPYSGYEISETIGMAPEIVVGLAGVDRAGKTATMTSIISALTGGRYFSSLRLDMRNNRYDSVWASIKDNIERYNKSWGMLKTEAKGENARRLSASVLVRFGGKQKVITFVDMPGELWSGIMADGRIVGLSDTFFRDYSGLYSSLDCIWLMISKLSVYQLGVNNIITEGQEKIIRDAADRVETIRASSAAFLDGSLQLLKNHLESIGRKMPPVAVILTKMDISLNAADDNVMKQYSLFPVGTDVNTANNDDLRNVIVIPGRGEPLLNEKRFWSFSSLVRQFLSAKNPGLCAAIERNCERRFYFSLAPYGHNTAADGSAGREPTPFHELFPMLWTLAITGVLPISHLKTDRRRDLFGNVRRSDESTVNVLFDYRINQTDTSTNNISDNLFFRKDRYCNTITENGRIV